jgi:hypothetical protein
MRIRIVMYGGVVTDVYVRGDGPDGSWLRLEDEFDYKIEQYPLEALLDKVGQIKGKSK